MAARLTVNAAFRFQKRHNRRGASLDDSLPRLARFATGGSKQNTPTDFVQLKIACGVFTNKAHLKTKGQE